MHVYCTVCSMCSTRLRNLSYNVVVPGRVLELKGVSRVSAMYNSRKVKLMTGMFLRGVHGVEFCITQQCQPGPIALNHMLSGPWQASSHMPAGPGQWARQLILSSCSFLIVWSLSTQHISLYHTMCPCVFVSCFISIVVSFESTVVLPGCCNHNGEPRAAAAKCLGCVLLAWYVLWCLLTVCLYSTCIFCVFCIPPVRLTDFAAVPG